jgi:protocatechuate 3,4-dioxygenase beta subunit
MDNDDRQVGRILNRREVLALLGAAGVGALAARAAGQSPTSGAYDAVAATSGATRVPACVVRPAQTEGPYFVDQQLERADIRSDPASGIASEGVPLDLEFRVSRVGGGSCAPLSGATVDVWQCDALGIYSDVRDMNDFFDTRGKKFLRGVQATDAAGSARFTSVYPGWYQGRTVHIHFKVRVPAGRARAHEFTSQIYFDDAVSDQVFARPPYAANAQRRVRNDGDGIFRTGGRQLLVALTRRDRGYAGTFDLGLQI